MASSTALAAEVAVEAVAPQAAAGEVPPAADPGLEPVPQAVEPIVSVHRQVRLARSWQRALAAAVDLLAVLALAGVYLGVALRRLPDSVGPARGTGFDRLIDATLVYQDATLPAGVVAVVLLVLYQTVFVALLGQTPGLMLVRCHVVALRQRRVSPLAAATRAVVAALGLLLLGVGWSLILVDSQRRALHDRIAGTLVGTAVDEVVTLLPQPAQDVVVPEPS